MKKANEEEHERRMQALNQRVRHDLSLGGMAEVDAPRVLLLVLCREEEEDEKEEEEEETSSRRHVPSEIWTFLCEPFRSGSSCSVSWCSTW